MGKTIKQLAEETYPIIPSNEIGNNFQVLSNSFMLCKREGYEAGANAVIEEVMSCWDWDSKDSRLVVPSDFVLHKIEEKIKELKGE